jgi:excisionase family DNA binding protein
MKHDDVCKIVHRSEDEWRAYLANEIAAARVAVYEPGEDDEELAGPASVPGPAPVDGLKTPSQAAQRLGVSTRTLRGLVSAADLRYVNVGRGKQREKLMFADSDLDGFIAERSRQKAKECQSISPRARRSTTSTSSGAVLVFTARRNGQTGGKRKR